MVRILDGAATFSLSLSLPAVLRTVAIFGAIFLLLFLTTASADTTASAIHAAAQRKRRRKAAPGQLGRWHSGAVLLAVAYCLAVTIKTPLPPGMFFVAVMLVISPHTF